MGSASDPPSHPARNLPAGSSYRLNKPPAAVETSIGPPHYSAECTHSHASVQPSLRARTGHANSDSFSQLASRSPPAQRQRRVLQGLAGKSTRSRFHQRGDSLLASAVRQKAIWTRQKQALITWWPE